MIVFGNRGHADAIAAAAGCSFNHACDVCLSREEHGELLGGTIYKEFTGASIRMHVAGFRPRWLNRDGLWVAFHYPFVQLGCKKILAEVPSSNHKALELDKKLGFIQEVIVPDVFPDGDLIVLSMRKEQCRWLNLKPKSIGPRVSHGFQFQSAAAA